MKIHNKMQASLFVNLMLLSIDLLSMGWGYILQIWLPLPPPTPANAAGNLSSFFLTKYKLTLSNVFYLSFDFCLHFLTSSSWNNLPVYIFHHPYAERATLCFWLAVSSIQQWVEWVLENLFKKFHPKPHLFRDLWILKANYPLKRESKYRTFSTRLQYFIHVKS